MSISAHSVAKSLQVCAAPLGVSWSRSRAGGIVPFAGTDDERVKLKTAEWNLQNRNRKDIQGFLDHEARTRMVNLHKLIEEKYVLHIKNSVDYQGRSFLQPPYDVGIILRKSGATDRCLLPGPSKSAHLLLYCSMDDRIMFLKVYYQRHCLRTCSGQVVREDSEYKSF
ncbi:pre-mRNA splicing factor prp17 [Culex quinquefasciatus]|uniref:Pre-mRNA splicing factor prp17 n=1 Tax=Culex quinquefasciatus TaxID=7176 RepID=B0WI15_CULQU|nr:pre-mRNA splicing factor prp17 [Culex quinquefasciatus]|eukprot:XP_001848349.1 pre-mRNA splicing factor prp17 [Culex quinquefasciatus]